MSNKIIFGIILLSIALGCKKTDDESAERLPDPMLLKVIGSEKLSNVSLANLYWYENGVKHSENDNTDNLDTRPFHLYYPIIAFDSAKWVATYDSMKPLLSSGSLVDISGRKNINVFYISYGNSSRVDTLNVLTDKVVLSRGYMYKLTSISQHGAMLNVDSYYKYETYPVYDLQ